MPFSFKHTDILVLGSGLAGLRAALTAYTTAPSLHITIVSAQPGPCGSSFANRNRCLGMQVCFSEQDRDELKDDIVGLAPPGMVRERLASLLVQESLDRFEDLVRLGVPFRRDRSGAWEKHPACFSPLSRRALIFDELALVFRLFQARLTAPRIDWLSDVHVLALLRAGSDPAVVGAWLTDLNTSSHLAIHARQTVLALGGPAPLFRFNVAGPGNPGYSYGLMREAGVDLCNTSFLQFMWSDVDSGAFFPVESLAEPGWEIGPDNISLPPEVAVWAPERATHCPCGYGRQDRLVDCFLADHLLKEGWVSVRRAGTQARLAPMVHAGNGGAAIDEHGRTNVPRLYACGECASGMHGANRIGGGMVLATQVFGHRAGLHAARSIGEVRRSSDRVFIQLVNDHMKGVHASSAAGHQRTRWGHGVLKALNACGSSEEEVICEPIAPGLPTKARLAARTYNAIVDHCLSLTQRTKRGNKR